MKVESLEFVLSGLNLRAWKKMARLFPPDLVMCFDCKIETLSDSKGYLVRVFAENWLSKPGEIHIRIESPDIHDGVTIEEYTKPLYDIIPRELKRMGEVLKGRRKGA